VAGIVRPPAGADSGGMSNRTEHNSAPSAAWVTQTYVSFAVSLSAAAIGIAYLPVDPWMRAFLAIALLYLVTSAISLSKAMRDQHESRSVMARVDEARMERLLNEHDPFKAPTF
jgi:hypothetical protein